MKIDDFVVVFFILYFFKSALGYNVVGKYHLEDVLFKPDEMVVDAMREFL